jgi:hypothetical protein
VGSDYSIQVQNKNGSVIYSAPDGASDRFSAAQIEFLQAGVGAVVRTVQSKLRDTVSVKDFGAVGDGVADDSSAILDALQSGAQMIYVPPGTYAMSGNISATIATDVMFYGQGTILYTGPTNNTNPLITIETGNNSLTIDGISFNGDDKIAAGVRIYNTAAPSSNTLPNCTVSNSLFINFRMNVAGIWNAAVYLAGSYQLVTIAKNRVRLITRAAGTGTPGSSGTTGIEVVQYSDTQYVRECLHYGNEYTAIVGGDAVGSANNVDYDGFKFFSPSPAADSGQYAKSTLTSYGNTYRNCRGRALKIQSTGSVKDETIIRDDDYTIFGGSTEINFQYGVGTVSDCQFFYRPYNGGATSPIQTGLTLVSFYQGVNYNEDTGSAVVDGIQVLNSIPGGVGIDIGYIVQAGVGAGVAAFMKPLVSVSNVSVNKNPIYAIAQIGYEATTYGTLRLDNITVPELIWGAVTTNGTDTNFDIVATNVFNRDGVATPANRKPFVTSTTGTGLVYGGSILGALNQGFLESFANISSNNKMPVLQNAFLCGLTSGGGISVQSAGLDDDETYTFDPRFYFQSRGLFAVSVNFDYTTQGLFATGSNEIHNIAAVVGNLFEVSTSGTNPDVDGKFNMWYTGGQLNVKNRLGDSYVVTVTFMG